MCVCVCVCVCVQSYAILIVIFSQNSVNQDISQKLVLNLVFRVLLVTMVTRTDPLLVNPVLRTPQQLPKEFPVWTTADVSYSFTNNIFSSPPLSFVKSHTCSFSLSILCMSSSYVIIFLCHFSQAAISIKISNLFVSVALICLVLYLKICIL